MVFANGWDASFIQQWMATNNEMAILSTYPADATNALDERGNALPMNEKSVPFMCASDIVGGGMVRHRAACQVSTPNVSGPILQPYWAAGMSFSKGHRIMTVPYDCCTPYLFNGEEFSMAARAWTYGYDFYAVHKSVTFHIYDRPAAKRYGFWSSPLYSATELTRSESRIKKVLRLDPEGEYNDTDINKYGLGDQRNISKFYKVFGINFTNSSVRDNCFLTTTGLLHKHLFPYLRSDRMGIDYSSMPDDILLGEAKTEDIARSTSLAYCE